MKRTNVLELAKSRGLEIYSVEPEEFGTVYRAYSVKKLEEIREELRANGYPKPISCHREEGGSDSYMIVWSH